MTHTDQSSPHNRCRLVLIMNATALRETSSDELVQILAAGDVASIVFSPGSQPDSLPDSLDETAFQSAVAPLVATAQTAGVAAIVADYSRTAGRVGADGIQLGQDPDAIRQAVEKFSPKMMVGAGNVKTRHNALVIGEAQPDYLMFGKPGGDIRPEPHPRNVELGAWWSAMVEIPCIVLGGTALQSAVDVAHSGSDFVALGAAIFAPQDHANESASDSATENAADRVRRANQLLDEHAPRFDTDED